jgi:long-chain acyl-CoA synthetase
MISRGAPRQPPGTLTQLFFETLDRFQRPDAYQVRRDGRYQKIPHATVLERVRRLALGMRELGLARGDRVAILSENCPEWAFADWACLTLGIADVPVYPTLPAEQIPHILSNSGAVAIFVSTPAQAEKIARIRADAPLLRHVITFGAEKSPGVDLALADVEARGAAVDSPARAAQWRAEALSVRPGDLATLIYTSGTTGLPKGVMLTHDNIYSNVCATRTKLPFYGDDVALSFLPLSHIFERTGDYLFWATGTSIAYAESIDTVPINMQEVRPTFCMSVPRLYEKMYARVFENALSGGWAKKQVFFWARRVAERWADQKLAGHEPRGPLSLQYALAQRLVFGKLLARTGGRFRFFVSGGAPLASEINKFFFSAGLVILEGYGLTETSPVISVNTPDAFRIGTVGKLVDGVEATIAADGEILTRGPHVMAGYYNNPEATSEAIDTEGWFHTGDIGVLEDGFLRITDRKKDIIVTAGGKNVPPQPIESKVKTNKYVSQAVMLGDKRKFLVLLVVPNWDQLEKWAGYQNIIWTQRSQLLEMPTIRAKMEKEVYEELSGLARFETPKKIALLEHDFSVERGELTPTLKVKRRVIERDYKALIDSLYAEPHAEG